MSAKLTNSYGLGRLITPDDLNLVKRALPEGTSEFSHQRRPGVIYIKPNLKDAEARTELLDCAKDVRTVEDDFLQRSRVERTTAIETIRFNVLGFKFRSLRNRPLTIRTSLVVEDLKNYWYPEGYQLLGEMVVASQYIGSENSYTDILVAKAKNGRAPFFDINMGSFESCPGDIPVRSHVIVRSPKLPADIKLSPINPVRG